MAPEPTTTLPTPEEAFTPVTATICLKLIVTNPKEEVASSPVGENKEDPVKVTSFKAEAAETRAMEIADWESQHAEWENEIAAFNFLTAKETDVYKNVDQICSNIINLKVIRCV